MITIYGASFCGWCTKAKELADKLEIQYEYIDIQAEDRRWGILAEKHGFKTIPQIFDGVYHIGGYQEFAMRSVPPQDVSD